MALPVKLCPRALPKRRGGLDVGSLPGGADVAQDGAAMARWSRGCGLDGGGGDGGGGGGGGMLGLQSSAPCATVHVPSRGASNLTLWLRVLSGTALLRLQAPTVHALSGDSSDGLHARLQGTEHAAVVSLSGAVPPSSRTATHSEGARATSLFSLLEPPSTGVSLHLKCDGTSNDLFEVRLSMLVAEHAPLEVAWRVVCVPHAQG